MNTLKTISLSTLIVLATGIFPGCSKDDTTAPTISLLGDDPYESELRDPYNDPGATAQDDEDGDISSSIIVDASNVDINLPGTYTVFYSVTDAAGNEGTASREVEIFATPAALADAYSVVDTITVGSADTVFNYAQNITAVNSTTIQFNKFGNYTPNATPVYVTATVSSNGTITIPSQTLVGIGTAGEDHTFQGSGTVTSTGIRLVYTDKNETQNVLLSRKATFTR